jgi:hypothetical protein
MFVLSGRHAQIRGATNHARVPGCYRKSDKETLAAASNPSNPFAGFRLGGRLKGLDLLPGSRFVAEPQGIDLREGSFALGKIILRKDGCHRASRLTSAAIDTLIRVYVEHPIFAFIELDAVNRANLNASLVLCIYAVGGNDVCHSGPSQAE